MSATDSVDALRRGVRPADAAGELERRVRARLDALTKPQGSMGRLEELALRLALAQGRERPRVERSAALVFAADHGVCAEGVSAYPGSVTAQLCYAYAAGGGVVNALARPTGTLVRVVDVGVDHDFPDDAGVVGRKVRRGTANFARGAAMTRDEAERALLAGAAAARELGRIDALAVGEVGIGNTTAAAALAALLTGAAPTDVVGRGTGIGDRTLDRKTEIVRRAVERHGGATDPIALLQSAGGLEFAAMAGAMLSAAADRVPVVLDGFASGVAALLAVRLAPATGQFLVAAHRSAERGHAVVLEQLALEPLLEWQLRLGEASGAVLALPLLGAACALLTDVATFEEAGVAAVFDPRGTE